MFGREVYLTVWSGTQTGQLGYVQAERRFARVLLEQSVGPQQVPTALPPPNEGCNNFVPEVHLKHSPMTNGNAMTQP